VIQTSEVQRSGERDCESDGEREWSKRDREARVGREKQEGCMARDSFERIEIRE